MQTNTDKVRVYRNEDKEARRDPKRDKFNAKELRKQDRTRKLRSRELE